MGRWDPDTAGRLREAAAGLYLQRGYDDVTVAEIAAAAGLTRRTFFRHFPDKREILFAGAEALQTAVVTAVLDAAADITPIEAAVTALAGTDTQLAAYSPFARLRRDLIASSPDLQEHQLTKLAELTAAVAEALRHRDVHAVQATLTAHAAVTVFTTAYDRWIDDDGGAELSTFVHQTLDDLRRAINP